MPKRVKWHRPGSAHARRHDAGRFYKRARWRRLRRWYLRRHPLCVSCERAGRTAEATEVDHVVPLRLRPDLAYAVGNLQALCKPCHSRKTGRERVGEREGTIVDIEVAILPFLA